MSVRARRNFDAQDVTIACAAALLAQLVLRRRLLAAVAEARRGRHLERQRAAHRRRDHAGAQAREQEPDEAPVSQWQRKQPVAAKTQPQAPLPSTQGREDAPRPSRRRSATAAAPVRRRRRSAEPAEHARRPPTSSAAATVASTEGLRAGRRERNGDRPAQGARRRHVPRAARAWFASHFNIRGKIPFDKLKKLHAARRCHVTPDRKVGGFSIVKPSGDSTFDAEVRGDARAHPVERRRAARAAADVPRDVLGSSLPVGFQCTVREALRMTSRRRPWRPSLPSPPRPLRAAVASLGSAPAGRRGTPSPAPGAPGDQPDESMLGTVEVNGSAEGLPPLPKMGVVPIVPTGSADSLVNLVVRRDMELSGQFEVLSEDTRAVRAFHAHDAARPRRVARQGRRVRAPRVRPARRHRLDRRRSSSARRT